MRKRFKTTALFLLTAFVCFVVFTDTAQYLSMAKYNGPKTDHFDGKCFHNKIQVPGISLWELSSFLSGLRPWSFEGEAKLIPSKNFPVPTPKEGEIVVTFVNHSTLLIQTGKLNILTDPQYSDRASPVSWAGPKRHHEPGVPYEKLPKIDVVLISHSHYDHMDKVTVQRLYKDFKPKFVVGLGNDGYLNSFGIKENVKTLDWWERVNLDDAMVTFTPAQHSCARSPFDKDATLWGGFVIQIGGTKIFFAGDTGFGPHFTEIKEKLGQMDLCLLPIGSYCPHWFMDRVHTDPDAAVIAHLALQSKKSIGIHFKTFQLSYESYDQPVNDLESAKKKYNIAMDSFVAPEFGESFTISG